MGVFDTVLKGDETLFKNEAALDYAFVPKLIPYREKEQQHIANCIKPILAGRNGRNLLIHGPPGIGKTAACKHLLRELEENDEFSEEVHLFYINCWQKNTTYKVILEMCDAVGYAFTQNKKTDDLFKIAANIINKKKAVFVFDEIDKAEEFDFLYLLLEEIFKKSIILITNYKSLLLEIDERIKSRLVPELLEFKQYNLKETEGILKERANYAFYDDVFEEEALQVICKTASEMKDIRSGLFLLKESALFAEERASKKVSLEHVKKAIAKLEEFTIKSSADLDDEERFIFKIVKENSGQKIGDLFREYTKQNGKLSYKTFQRKIAKLDEGNYINLERTHKGGNTTIVNKKLTDY
ncbi:NACHT domain-containing protein [Candidatus Woesearchaeota archaeon]|nr:MAG: NACHT domain-containing protein [Candidatus Woesearchaeota archaeon]